MLAAAPMAYYGQAPFPRADDLRRDFAMTTAITRALTTPTPQSKPLDERQTQNNAGGYAYTLGVWARLDRFLILGTEGGTYYVTERDLTIDNVAVADQALTEDGPRTVARLVEVSTGGLAPRQTPTLYALAAACSHPDPATRAAANDAVVAICRTGTHLFEWMAYMKNLTAAGCGRGWGRGRRRTVAHVLTSLDAEKLGYHAVKYRQRFGWVYRDLLRLSHPKTSDPARRATFDFMCGRASDLEPDIIGAYRAVNRDGVTAKAAAGIIHAQRLPWEAVPDRLMNTVEVQEALLASMPVTATVRQLARFARLGMLTPMGATEQTIVTRLNNATAIAKSRAHPLVFLDALMVHASGGTVGRSRGDTYQPNQAIIQALDHAFRLAFGNVTPAGKATYIGLDVSASMYGNPCAGSVALDARHGSVAMALITAASEPLCHIAAFTGEMVPVAITGASTLQHALDVTDRLPFGRTDCAQPILDAEAKGMRVETFVIYTDNETWCGRIHPTEALRRYRQASGIEARLIVVGMTSTGFTVADPADPLSLDVVGFNTAAPQILSTFSAGDV